MSPNSEGGEDGLLLRVSTKRLAYGCEYLWHYGGVQPLALSNGSRRENDWTTPEAASLDAILARAAGCDNKSDLSVGAIQPLDP